MLSKKILLRILVNTLLGAVLILIWLKLVDLGAVLAALAKVNLFSLLPFVAFFATSGLLRAIRLKLLLKNSKIQTKNIIFLTYLSQLLSFIIPIRAGEITKGVYLSTQYDIPLPKSVVLILVDRFLDFWLTLCLALIFLLFLPTKLPLSFKPVLFLLVLGLTIMLVLAVFYPSLTKKIAQIIGKLLIFKKLNNLFTRFSEFVTDTIGILNQGLPKISGFLMLTFFALLSDALGWFVFFKAIFEVPFLTVFLGTLLTSLTYLIPAAPGYIGSAEAAGVAVFGLALGLDKTLVSAATVLNHGLTLICLLIFGLISLYLLKFDVRLIWKRLKRG